MKHECLIYLTASWWNDKLHLVNYTTHHYKSWVSVSYVKDNHLYTSHHALWNLRHFLHKSRSSFTSFVRMMTFDGSWGPPVASCKHRIKSACYICTGLLAWDRTVFGCRYGGNLYCELDADQIVLMLQWCSLVILSWWTKKLSQSIHLFDMEIYMAQ